MFKRVRTAACIMVAAAAMVLTGSLSVFAGQVDFETFVKSVKGGEFVLSASVDRQFTEAINSGNTEKAMEIYKDFFDGDNSDEVAFKSAKVTPSEDADDEKEQEAESEASQEGEYKEESQEEKDKSEEIKAADAQQATAQTADTQQATAQAADTQQAQPQPQESAVLGATAGAGEHAGLSDAEYLALCKICYAEAHTQGEEGMLLIANVIMNRVKSFRYPSSVVGVISQPGQFGPVRNGTYAAAVPDAATMRAVDRALSGENKIPGAVYFRNSAKNGIAWGNRVLVATFGNHSFYF